MNEDQITDSLRQAYEAEALNDDAQVDVAQLMARANRGIAVRDLLMLGFTNVVQAFLLILSRVYTHRSTRLERDS